MANPFLGLTPYGTDYTSQYNFFESIRTIINGLENKAPIIVESTTVPTQVQMETLYLAATVGNTLPVPTSQDFIWVNQGVVQGEYRTIDDLWTNVNDVSHQAGTVPGFAFIMSNGDIINSAQRNAANTVVTTSLSKYDRRTGTLSQIALTVGLPDSQFYMSPDGTKIVFTKLDGGSKQQIYTAPYPALTPVTQLTTSTLGAQTPCWQGTKISYIENIGGNWTIKIMNENGTSQTTVLATGVAIANKLHQLLSPDTLNIIYTKYIAGPKMDVWKVSSAGSGNAKFVDSTSTTDNPDSEMGSSIVPNWSSDSLWVMYARRRKNINTNVSEKWFNYLPDDNMRYDMTQTYYTGSPAGTRDWYNRNLIYDTNFIGRAADNNSQLLPVFPTTAYGGKIFLSATTYLGPTPIQNYPLMMIANQSDGYKSTGKIHKTSQYVPDRNDFELIRTDIFTGTETTVSLSKSELLNFDHLMIVVEGAGSAAITNLFIYLNEDSTSGNYQNTNILANTTLVRAYQTYGDTAILAKICGTIGTSMSMDIITLMDIQSSDNYKQALTNVFYSNSASAFAIANYFAGDLLGIWKNIAPVESIRLVAGSALAAGTSFSYYGIRGTPRFEKDI